jgi:hypothetical protein
MEKPHTSFFSVRSKRTLAEFECYRTVRNGELDAASSDPRTEKQPERKQQSFGEARRNLQRF